MRRAITWGGAAVAACAIATLSVLPPPAVDLGSPEAGATDVRLAFHVHSRRSDGTGTRESIAAAARRAGVDVVVLTDHGDGTRRTDPAAYIDDVLVIDGVEISTWGGHYAVVGARSSPYPLGGEPSAVVEDVRRLGGFGIVAHPASAKDALRWRAWDAQFDAIEWLNADSEWRDRPWTLWRTFATYPWRPAESLAALIDEPADALAAWDRVSAIRQAVGLAGHDIHARIGTGGGEPRDGWVVLEAPAYEQAFRAFANVVRLPAPLDRDPGRDSAAVLEALRLGHVYGVVTGVATPGRFSFRAESGGRTASLGDALVPSGTVRMMVEADVPTAATTRLVCGGVSVADAPGGRLSWESDRAPGACRAEIRVTRGGRQVPWLVSNPIYARPVLTAVVPAEASTAIFSSTVPRSGEPDAWASEVRSGSTVTVRRIEGPEPRLGVRWQLDSDAAAMPYVAIRFDVGDSFAAFDRLVVRGEADRPVRVWVQLRSPTGSGQRWGRSVYFDTDTREVVLPFASFLPLGVTDQTAPRLSEVTAMLWVVDTTYASPGTTALLTLAPMRLAR